MSDATNQEIRALFEDTEASLARLRSRVLSEEDTASTGVEDAGCADQDYAEFEKAAVLAFGNWVLDFLGLDDQGDVMLRVKLARRQLVDSLSRGMPAVQMSADDMLGQGYDIFDDKDLEHSEDELGVAPVQLTVE